MPAGAPAIARGACRPFVHGRRPSSAASDGGAKMRRHLLPGVTCCPGGRGGHDVALRETRLTLPVGPGQSRATASPGG